MSKNKIFIFFFIKIIKNIELQDYRLTRLYLSLRRVTK